MNNSLKAVSELGGEILESVCFRRLADITFLGILSPRFSSANSEDDGSRADHSLAVAAIALDFTRALELSAESQHYAVAWGLVHDIATWPLSHTSEPAFEEILGTSARKIRLGMINNEVVESRYYLAGKLRRMNVDPKKLSLLFDRSGPPPDGEQSLLWQLLHSPITPDTLEGIGRAGRAFGVPVPTADDICSEIWREGDRICFHGGPDSAIERFWEAKGRIYADFINRPDVVLRESTVSHEIRSNLRKPALSIGQSLQLSEHEVLERVPWQRAISFDIFRYKPPLVYWIDRSRWQSVKPGASLDRLSDFLIKSPGDRPSYGAA